MKPTAAHLPPARRAGLISVVLGLALIVVGLAAYAGSKSVPLDALLQSGDPNVRQSIETVGEDAVRTILMVVSVLILIVGFATFAFGLWQLRRGGVVSAVFLCVLHGVVLLFGALQVLAALISGAAAGLVLPLLMCVGFGIALNWSIRAAFAAGREPQPILPAQPSSVSPLGLAAQAPLSGYYVDVDVAGGPETGR